MTLMSKLCDAADWFRSDIQDIITNELRETPRLHRKQWESAMIFLNLRQAGKLRPDSLGLSMGGGRELIMYAIAPHVQQLVVTDLYDMQTDWDCAKTNDPDALIKLNKPFPVDDAKLKALRMDMRDLHFPDKSFDFCYSTCAVEHIGAREDFLKHFNEVARVLKDDGVYVFTTEVSYANETIKDEHNYVFSLQELYEILAESNLIAQHEFDARITRHKINYPTPSNLKNLSHFTPALFTEQVLRENPHIQLMRGKHPFTCGIFVMGKRPETAKSPVTGFVGLDSSRTFMNSGTDEYRSLLQCSSVSINPFSSLPGESSRFFADHTEFFSHRGSSNEDTETVFHSDYFWFGQGKRVFDVILDPIDADESNIEVRVHTFKTLASRQVDCIATASLNIVGSNRLVYRLEVVTDEECNYAILAKARRGSCLFKHIEIKSYPSQLAPQLSDITPFANEPINEPIIV
ncbi:MAG: class I SAM-dependent methyltransferase [Bacteroidota bacterium]